MAGPSNVMLKSPWTPQTKAEQYQEVSLLGKGAYGKVYLVRDRISGEHFALKKIQVPITDDGIPQSVMREVSVMKSFIRNSHPNVLQLHDFFHYTEGSELVCSMVVEKCDWDLYTFLRDIPRDMPDHQCRMIARQLMDGIDYLHGMNVIHRDLKPQNILINRNQTIKIADFGLSRTYGLQSTFTTIVVTLWYRSPELLLQTKYNSAVDIWAAGCIISELYGRKPLFPGQTEAEQLDMVFQKLGTPSLQQWPSDSVVDYTSFPRYPPNPIELLNPRLPQDAADAIRQCLAFESHRRPTAAEVKHFSYFVRNEPRPLQVVNQERRG